ncbi:outer membrane protein assembly factor BamE [Amaricoccus tamworthensis]|uniref:outer membrane protein assembly factor BamE n=1 Tax=Amaricoccus tamworthensis TaxID=57002 RepID=UPI003C79FFC0
MKSRTLLRLIVGASLTGLIAAGCAPTIRVHGYVPSDAEIEPIRPGVDTQQTVAEALGNPTASGLLEDSTWYYVESVVRNYTYNAPEVIDRTVLAIEFNSAGTVTGMVRYGIEDGRIINLTTRTTETGGRKLSALEQIFGNLLTLDAEQFQN